MAKEVAVAENSALSTDEDLTKTVRAGRLLAQYESDVEQDRGTHTLSKEIPDADRRVLTDRLHSLSRQLTGLGISAAGRDRAAAAVLAMFRDGWPLYRVDNPVKIVAAYVNALQDHPVWAVESVCGALAKGMVDDANVDYPPSAARVVQLCTDKTTDLRAQRLKFQRVLAIKEIRPPQMSGEQRERMRGKFQQLRDDLAPDQIGEDERRALEESTRRKRQRDESLILREYKALGKEPLRTSAGVLISPWLAKKIGSTTAKPKAEMDQ